MKRISLFLGLAAAVVFASGCAAVDDSREQSEYEKLRTHPVTPAGDRPVPMLESKPAPESELPYALHRAPRITGAGTFAR